MPNVMTFIRSVSAPFVPDADWLDPATPPPAANIVQLPDLVPDFPNAKVTTLELVGIPYLVGGALLPTMRTIAMLWFVESLLQVTDNNGDQIIITGNNGASQVIGYETRIGTALGRANPTGGWLPRIVSFTAIDATVDRIDMFYKVN